MFKSLFKRAKLWPVSLRLRRGGLSAIYGLAGAFIIAAGWNWYHLKHRPYGRFALMTLFVWAAVYAGYRIFKWLYGFLIVKLNRHVFWQKDLDKFFDSLFFICSLFFLIFFSRDELLSVVITLLLLRLLFWKTQTYLSGHPNAAPWKAVNKTIFTLIFFLFTLFSVWQYAAFRLSNFDAYLKVYNIVFFRSWAMTMFWISGFIIATLIYWKIKNRWRYLFLVLWDTLFLFTVFLWHINIGIMYFSGLYLSPMMLGLVNGSSGVVLNWLTAVVIMGGLITFVIFGLVFRQVLRAYKQSSLRQWVYYSAVLIAMALFSIFGLSSFKNAPEYVVVRSFYQFFRGSDAKIELSPIVKEKLQRFGLYYHPEDFYLARKDKVFSSLPGEASTKSGDKKLLPDKFADSKPNIIIIFLESFSARLTSVYNQNFAGLTPGFQQMADDAHTTVFKKYYNASTPTITGIISQLCSFLPPAGYTDTEVNRQLQRLRLLCLPKILKESGGYKSATYITAVDKKFENKNSIFSSMDTENIYGADELRSIISGEPLSWGYSDHQTFPAMWQIAQKEPEPFLLMYSTVDTHAPFNIAKDMVPYKDGKNNVLNSFHTADDAFAKFWDEFKLSKYYNNTIVIAVADHAAFPGADIKKLFPQEADKLSFYDPNLFMMYIPDSKLPKEVNTLSSGVDVTPTLLQILNINVPNTFEGHSIFDDRNKYPNLLGMHEFGLYINQTVGSARDIRYEVPSDINCGPEDFSSDTSTPLTLCEYLDFYKWKRQMFEQGRFWQE